MERQQLLAVLLYRRRKRRQQRNRLVWIHPINLRRNEVGALCTLFEDLRNDEAKFFNYFRMSVSSFDELHGHIKDKIQRKNSQLRNCVQPVEMLAVTLR